MFKIKLWKLPFLLVIAILSWIIIFPTHTEEIAKFYSEYRIQKAEDKRHADAIAPSPQILIELLCDDRLDQHLEAKVVAGSKCSVDGCGKIENCPAYFVLGELRRDCGKNKL